MPDLPTPYQQQIHQSKYSRWREDLGRRERWEETPQRFVQFFSSHLRDRISEDEIRIAEQSIVNLEVVPSMRALMTAGPALEKDNAAGYNCSYLTISRQQAFDEIMYILMCGCGVGYSVERKQVAKLPEIPAELHETDTCIVVADSKLGWSSSYRQLIGMLYDGYIPKWDVSRVRPAGSVLKTFGGRASGPEPLERLFRHTIEVFTGARGRKLTSKEAHSVVCMIADIVVVGGVRRSAMIALFDFDDREMLHAKTGAWANTNPHFGMANNSAVFDGRPNSGEYLEMMTALIQSQAGEPGIFNRAAAREQARRVGRDADHDFGTNPCGEIILRDRQFCNLSEVIVRPDLTRELLVDRVAVATMLGTWQSTLTDFRYLSPQWKRNCEEERLLGVSLTGIQDHPVLNGSKGYKQLETWLGAMREHARDTNAVVARQLGIPASASITCVKPSGNTSQLADTASGIHPRYSKYYIRRTRGNKTDPVSRFLVDSGVPHEDERFHPDTTWVFAWPQKSPQGARTRYGLTAVEMLKLWRLYHDTWTDHKPSCTIYVKDEEWPEVISFVWEHFDKMSGVAFLPGDDHSYQQAPYEEVTREGYESLKAKMPRELNWDQLTLYEQEDQTNSARELACSAGACEI